MKKVKFLSAILSIAFSAGLVFSVPTPVASAFDSFEELKSHFQQRAETFTVDFPATKRLDRQLAAFISDATTTQTIMDRYITLFESNRGSCRHCSAFYFKALEELKQKGIVQQNYQLDILNLSREEGHIANLYQKDNQWYVADFMLAHAIENYKKSHSADADATITKLDPFQVPVEIYANLRLLNAKVASMAVFREYNPGMRYLDYDSLKNTVDIRELLSPEKRAILNEVLDFTFNYETETYDICSNSALGLIQEGFNLKKLDWTPAAAPLSAVTEPLSDFRQSCLQMWVDSRGNSSVVASVISQYLTIMAKIKNYEIKIPAKNGKNARIINLYHCFGTKWCVADFTEARTNDSRDFFNVDIKEYLSSNGITVNELLVFNKDAATVGDYQARPIRTAEPELANAIDRALAS